jgi:hypothetical protein
MKTLPQPTEFASCFVLLVLKTSPHGPRDHRDAHRASICIVGRFPALDVLAVQLFDQLAGRLLSAVGCCG